MPSSSAKQHRFMAAIAHNPLFAKKVGVSQSVGKDFNAADKGKTFNKGGMMKMRKFAEAGYVDDSDMDDEGNTISKYSVDPNSRRAHGLYDAAPKKTAAKKTYKPDEPRGAEERRAYGAMKAEENRVNLNAAKERAAKTDAETQRLETADKRQQQGKDRLDAAFRQFRSAPSGTQTKPIKRESVNVLKKGGNVMESKKMVGREMAFMKKKGAPASMLKHEKAEMGMKKGGMPMKDGKPAFMKRFAKGGGIESRGKTKGTVIRMASGGSVSSASRRADGIAQRGKTRC